MYFEYVNPTIYVGPIFALSNTLILCTSLGIDTFICYYKNREYINMKF